ncbi:MAG: hypothetical protein AVDCRST_MAG49-4010, partial [uncultured Thermomicrobiales bacterium]
GEHRDGRGRVADDRLGRWRTGPVASGTRPRCRSATPRPRPPHGV